MSHIINREIGKNIEKLRKTQCVNLLDRSYTKKATVASKMEKRVSNLRSKK